MQATDATNTSSVPSLAKTMGTMFGLTLTSGKRSAEHNKEIGGSPTSFHVTGQAYDFSGTPTAMKKYSEWAKASGIFSEVIYESAGHYDHVHVGWGKKNGKGTDETIGDSPTDSPAASGGTATTMFTSVIRVLIILAFIILTLVFFIGAFPAAGNAADYVSGQVKKQRNISYKKKKGAK